MISRDFFSVANNLGDSVAFNLESDSGIVVKEVVEGSCAIKTVKFRIEPADNGWLYPEKCVKPETVASTGKVVH